MRRVSLLVILAFCVWPLTSGVASGSATTTEAAASIEADFNNDGFADLAVGVPFEDVGGTPDAGAVNVLYGSAGKLTGAGSQNFNQNTTGVAGNAEAQDNFGFMLATGDFNQDGFADLAIGVPGENRGAGQVNVLYGSAGKLTGAGDQIFNQDSEGVGGSAQAGDGFGAALAAGDFNNDTFDDLAVGVPFEDAGGSADRGTVNVLYGSAGRLTGVGSQIFNQDSEGVGGSAQADDLFGFALAAGDFNNDTFDDLAVGVPFEDAGGSADRGTVNVLYGSAGRLTGVGSQVFNQDSEGVGGSAQADDLFGFALTAGDFNQDDFADLAIGAPGEGIGGTPAVGVVNVLYGSAGKLTGVGSQLFSQDSEGVGSVAEAGDVFGFALAAGDFNNDSFADLAVGAFDEAVGSDEGAGAVNVLYGSAGKLTGVGSQLFHQDTADVAGVAEPFDGFGFALTAADFNNDTFDDLAVGVPFEGVAGTFEAGAANALYGSAGKLTGVGSQIFTQNSDGVGGSAEDGDLFGEALAASGPQSLTASPASTTTASTSGSAARRTAP